jgi:hypothetical protein
MIEIEVLKVEVADQKVCIDATGHTYTVRDYAPTEIYVLEIREADGVWCETFNTDRELRFFLRGMRAAFAVGPAKTLTPPVVFSERSCVQSL